MTLPPSDELIEISYHPMVRKARTNKKGPLTAPKKHNRKIFK
jgi:hypothetical protein